MIKGVCEAVFTFANFVKTQRMPHCLAQKFHRNKTKSVKIGVAIVAWLNQVVENQRLKPVSSQGHLHHPPNFMRHTGARSAACRTGRQILASSSKIAPGRSHPPHRALSPLFRQQACRHFRHFLRHQHSFRLALQRPHRAPRTGTIRTGNHHVACLWHGR